MADFSALKTAIQTYIKQNGNEEITGEILQEILLSVVTTLGDSAINNLVTALADEVAARQNADGTLQQNITNEATARGNADTALSNRLGSTITAENTAAEQIGAEAEAREAADTALQGLIDGITDNIENGYVYAGIATPSSTPTTGKVFYLALTAGTYTNFGSTVVSQGINILKYNGSAWSLDTFIGIDDTPTPNSPNLVKSGGAFDSVMTNGSAFDISAHFASGGTLATYADLDAALAALNTLSASYKRGGMSIKFVQSSDNKYVQYRLKSQTFSTNIEDWQDENNIPVSKNGSSADLDITDDNNNILARFENGHIKTEKFDSSNIIAQSVVDNSISNNKIKNQTIEEEKLAKVHPISEENLSDSDLDVADNNGNIVMQLKGGHICTKNFNSRDIAQNYVIIDVNGGGKYTSITEASASEPANTVFLIMPGVYDDENVQGCDTKKQHFIGYARESTIVKNHQNGNNNCVFTIGAGSLINLTIIKEYSESAVVESNSYAVHADSNSLYNDTLLIDNCFIKSEGWACAVGMGMKGGCHVTFKNSYFVATNLVAPAAYAHDNDLAGYDGVQTWTMIDCVFYNPNGAQAIGFQSMGKEGRNSIYNIEMIRTRLKATNASTPYWIRNWYETEPTAQDFLGLVNGRLIETSWGNSCSDFNNA